MGRDLTVPAKGSETYSMRKILLLLLVTAALAMPGRAHAFGTRGSWIASGGFGLTISPTLVLLNPQLEYVQRSNLFIGPMIQAGLGDPGVLFTASGTARLLIGHHPKLKPAIEGGLGIAFASSAFASSVGVHILVGMGVDYFVDKDIAIGTMIRANLAPPVKTFFLSWPIIVGRFAI